MTELKSHLKNDYKYGFVTEIESESFKKGLNEEVITQISQVKQKWK